VGTPRPGRRHLEGYLDVHDEIGTGSDARGPALLMIDQQPGQWAVRQIFDDPAGDHDWGISAVVDLDASTRHGSACCASPTSGTLSVVLARRVLARRVLAEVGQDERAVRAKG